MLSQLKKPFIGKGHRLSHEQRNGRDLVQVMLLNLATHFKLDSDNHWSQPGISQKNGANFKRDPLRQDDKTLIDLMWSTMAYVHQRKDDVTLLGEILQN